eukprot:scaffold68_cov84-Amphora_coffeaeformis.AAC.1
MGMTSKDRCTSDPDIVVSVSGPDRADINIRYSDAVAFIGSIVIEKHFFRSPNRWMEPQKSIS